MSPGPVFPFDNTYARDLEGFYAPCAPAQVPQPELVQLNRPLAEELGLDAQALDTPIGAAILGGNEVPLGARPIAQAYAGHQFGGFSPQLGDGRAVLLGEVVDRRGRRRDIAFKGSGRTPFSRSGDGKAAVGPALREFLMGEAMHALGIPTTRALAVVRTGESILRDRALPGAVLTRVAASHVRVGTFEFFAARGQYDKVRQLADYAIARHDPDLVGHPDRYLEWLRAVSRRQALLVAQWMHVGFIHGVMNTDNMTVSGETIDYGPCAFMEAYDSAEVFSSIDHAGRYAFGNQPAIARWNLTRFAETLLPLMADGDTTAAVDAATGVLNGFVDDYEAAWLEGARAKLGFTTAEPEDEALARDWLTLLEQEGIDFTLAWRRLADAAGEPPEDGLAASQAPARFGSTGEQHAHDGGTSEGADDLVRLFSRPQALQPWLARWCARLAGENIACAARARSMRAVSPIYIPRNHMVEVALAAASERGDLRPFEELLDVVSHPYEAREGLDAYAEPAPTGVTEAYRTFCGT